jgi:SH3 domain protein
MNFRIGLTILLLCLGLASQAETRYINDTVYVPMRSGPSPQHRIIHKGLKTGTALEIVEYNDDESWALARSGELEGWVPTHYLVQNPVAAIVLEQLRSEHSELNAKHQQLSNSYSSVSQEKKRLEAQVNKLDGELTQSTLELNRVRSVYSGAIELDQKYQELLENYEVLQTEKNALTAENDNLKSDNRISFMFYGAFLVFLGMLAITIIPRFKPQKRNSDWIN